jgi:hypothetical protein
MSNAKLKTSAAMAAAMGIFLPLAETVRRINQVLHFEEFFSWFDDYILGAVLLLAAYAVYKKKKNARAYLIAAWSLGVAALVLSFIGQLSYYNAGEDDPGIFSTSFVLLAKGAITLYMLTGLMMAIKSKK